MLVAKIFDFQKAIRQTKRGLASGAGHPSHIMEKENTMVSRVVDFPTKSNDEHVTNIFEANQPKESARRSVFLGSENSDRESTFAQFFQGYLEASRSFRRAQMV